MYWKSLKYIILYIEIYILTCDLQGSNVLTVPTDKGLGLFWVMAGGTHEPCRLLPPRWHCHLCCKRVIAKSNSCQMSWFHIKSSYVFIFRHQLSRYSAAAVCRTRKVQKIWLGLQVNQHEPTIFTVFDNTENAHGVSPESVFWTVSKKRHRPGALTIPNVFALR